MTIYAFPTVADIGGSGKGKTSSEQNLAGWMNRATDGTNDIVTGFNPTTSANLTLTVPAGEAIIAGYRVIIDTASTVTIGASTTTWVYLTLTRDGANNVTAASFTTSTTTSVPTAAQVKVSKVTSSGTAITAVENYQVQWINVGELGAPAYTNSWVTYGAPYPPTRFCKRNGIVYVEGLVKNGSAITAAIFTLPTGYRPNGDIYLAAASNSLLGTWVILATGNVAPVTGSTTWFGINHSFPADQ
jgi:hypothetical protein